MYKRELDYAYFAANLGWLYEEYASHTPVELLFIRKELEKKVVQDSELFKAAVQVAVANALGKKKHKLWNKKGGTYDESAAIPIPEIQEISDIHETNTPWTPWKKNGGENRG